MPNHLRTPSYRLHKPSGHAVVTLGGKDHYLGQHGTQASRRGYDRLIGEWLTNGRLLPTDAQLGVTVSELVAAYWRFAGTYYRKDDAPTVELAKIKAVMRPVCTLYGHKLACGFGPLDLKTVRSTLVSAGFSRKHVNDQVGRVKRMFRWATENELVSPIVHQGLTAVVGLRRGRSEAREPNPVGPASQTSTWMPSASTSAGRCGRSSSCSGSRECVPAKSSSCGAAT